MPNPILKTILNPEPFDPNFAREVQELKNALASYITPGTKVMRLGYGQRNTENVQTKSQGESQ